MDSKKYRFETLQIHAGLQPDEPTGARGVAIYPTAAYRFKNCDHAARLFELSEGGNIYTRLQNPTTTAYEQRIAALYGAVGALAVSSGMSAILIAVLSLAAEGDNIVASPFLYGGTYNQFRTSLRRLGIDCRIAPSERPEDFEALIDSRTKALYAESMGNPTCAVPDLEALGELARRRDIPFIVDNTFGAAGYLCNPFEWGANIVVDSATKWINGHGTAMGGVIVDGGNFDWKASGKYAEIAEPNPSYHGVSFAEAAGPAAFATYVRAILLRDEGACISPFNAWILLQGTETLSLRVDRHVENTKKVVEFLANDPHVASVNHPSLPNHPDHELYERYFPNGGASILTFEIKGGQEAAWKFIDSLQIFSLLANVADVKSLAIHPATTTHSQLTEAELADQGITPSTIRLSIGTENADDIIWDLQQAFAKLD